MKRLVLSLLILTVLFTFQGFNTAKINACGCLTPDCYPN